MSVKQFLPEKYYKHSNGNVMHTIEKIQSNTWGECLLSENPRGEFSAINSEPGVIEKGYSETPTVGWKEITENEWDQKYLRV